MKSIRTKLTVTYILLILVIISSVGVVTSVRIESFFQQRLVGEVERQIDLVFFLVQQDSLLSTPKLFTHLEAIARAGRYRITLIDSTGHVLLDSDVPLRDTINIMNHSDRPEILQAAQNGFGKDIRHSATVNHDFLYVAKTVAQLAHMPSYQKLKFIRISVPLEEVDDQIHTIRSIIIVVGTVISIIILIASLIISQFITRPMLEITRSIERIRAGDFNEQLPVKSNDETGLIATAINELVANLRADIIQLKKLEQVRSQFLGNVSHELRTPLFAIQGFLETLLNGAVDDPAVNRTFIERALSNLTRLSSLMEDLINISRIESGEMRMSFRYFGIKAFLESLYQDYQPIAAARTITLKLRLNTTEEDTAYGDRERLRQVFNNLLTNGISYNKPNGELVIQTDRVPQGIQISVIDTGIGIAEQHRSRIFERFYRIDKDRSREVGGTGLGLAIVKHIVEAHGSHVEVESTHGEGSTFRFVLKAS
jgi:two-component system phosphate regulon sensor histidine kinase PhoR